jgi:peptidoglycan/LPS O-acetylase OafA/YrhL
MLERFSRIITRGRHFIPQIDGLRFVAIGTVVAYHIAHEVLDGAPFTGRPHLPLQVIFQTGSYGVRLFFAISGFLLALPFARAALAGGERVSLKAYFVRRVTRLEPPYILMLLAVAFADALAHSPKLSLPRLASALVYQHLQVFGELYPANAATWSLETEVQFYCLTPLLVTVFLIRPTWLRRAVIGGVIVCVGTLTAGRLGAMYRWDVSALGHLHEFFAGYLLADVYIVDWGEVPERGGLAWDGLALAGWAAIPVLLMFATPFARGVTLPFVVFAVYAATMRGPLSRWIFSRLLLTVTGGMCYTIYLFHGPLMRFTHNAAEWVIGNGSPEQFFLGYAAVWLPIVAVGSFALFAAVERPCMDASWPARFGRWVHDRARIGVQAAPDA